MGGGGKENMKTKADGHFDALKLIIPAVSRLMLFDYDVSDRTFHPLPDNPSLVEWKRKNIENYLMVQDAWKRAALWQMGCGKDDLFAPITKWLTIRKAHSISGSHEYGFRRNT